MPGTSVDQRYKADFYRQMKTFAEAIAAGRDPAPPACLLSEAVGVMKIIEAVAGSGKKMRCLGPK